LQFLFVSKFKLVFIIFILQAVRRSDLFDIMKRDADKLREEEEKVYQESLARAQLRLQEVPLKTTLN
jgi:hypothetical protein